MTVALLELLIECFHSHDQHLCKFIETKESVCIRKEFNSQRTGLGHQHGRRFIVLGHQYGRRDVMWKHSISSSVRVCVLSFVSRHRQNWTSLLCRLASAGYSNKKVKLNQRGLSGGDSSWSMFSEAQRFHKVVTYFWNSHETQTTFACSQEKVPREGEVFWMKKHFIHFFSTKCIVPIITEMQLFKVHTNKLRIEININGFSFEFAKL